MTLSWPLFILQYVISTGVALGAHWVLDGYLPTGPAKTSAAEPTPSEDSSAAKRLPIGTKVSSNSHCPQTGIWQCAADAPGITQHRQFITAGKPMPYGVTQQAAKSVNGFFGRREDVTVDVAWTLIAYEKDAT